MAGILEAIYEKEWMNSYLKIPYEQTIDGLSDEQMIFYTAPKGLLGFNHVMNDGVEYCRYNITGRKALTAMFQSLPVKEWHLKRILESLLTAIDSARDCLLSENNIVLLPEQVFVNISDYSAEFVYLPDYDKPLEESMEGFLEYLLNRVDYDDKPAVELIYDCYMLVIKADGGLDKVKERLKEEKKQVSELHNKAEVPAEQALSNRSDSAEISLKQTKRAVDAGYEPIAWDCFDDDEDEEDDGNDTGLFQWIKDLFRRKKSEEIPIVAEGSEEFGININEDLFPQENEKTVFLACKTVGTSPYLLSIGDGSVIRIERSPFCVGSMKEQNGYALKEEGVSRLHARIYSDADGWHVADLNSTNGTFVNEQEVLPGKDSDLYNNDKIRFAGAEFIFKNSKFGKDQMENR